MMRFARRFTTLLAVAGTVGAAWLVIHQHDFVPHDRIDSYILTYIGAVYAVAALFLLGVTERWTLRGAGQLCTLLGDAGLYLTSGGSRLGWRGPMTRGEADLVRALFVVGGTALLIGLLAWAGGETARRHAPEPTDPPWDGVERRQFVRRQADRERMA